MRTQQRSFVVEIKSTRRRSKTQPKSIWGDTDFGALVRDAEATLPFMQNVISETSLPPGDLPLKREQQTELGDFSNVDEKQPSAAPSLMTNKNERHPQEAVSTDNDVSKIVGSEPKRRTAKPLNRRRARRETIAEDVGAALLVMTARDVVKPHLDALLLLEAENNRLKRLFAEYLRQQNAQLRIMLERFEKA
jgi:hypothetical protein